MNENSTVKEYFTIRGVGKPRRYTPEEFLNKANQYFSWCKKNPLQREEIVKYKEHYEKVNISLLRVYTIEGLCSFADTNKSMFYEYEKIKEYTNVCSYIRGAIYKQKFEGAAAGLLKENLIIRDLKIKDTQEIEHKNGHRELLPPEIKHIQQNMLGNYGLPPGTITIDIEHEEIND